MKLEHEHLGCLHLCYRILCALICAKRADAQHDGQIVEITDVLTIAPTFDLRPLELRLLFSLFARLFRFLGGCLRFALSDLFHLFRVKSRDTGQFRRLNPKECAVGLALRLQSDGGRVLMLFFPR